MKYLFVFSFVVVFFVFDRSIGYTDVSPLWTHFAYMFQHVNIIHLCIDSIAFVGMFRVMEKFIDKRFLAASILFIGFAASFFSMHPLPTVGISGAVYAMIGMYFAMITSKRLIVNDRKKLCVFAASVFVCLTMSFFKPSGNFRLHLFSLISGYAFRMIFDSGNAAGNKSFHSSQ